MKRVAIVAILIAAFVAWQIWRGVPRDEGAFLGYVILFRDLTEVRHLKKEVARSQRLASLGNLAAGVAHDIGNPIAALVGLEELLLAAEYIRRAGNHQVILCERGIRTFEPYTRNTLDLSVVPAVQRLSHLPIIVDPSHGTGKRNKVTPLSRAAVAMGADGLMVEVHNNPDKALSDGVQSLYPDQFDELMAQVRQIARGLAPVELGEEGLADALRGLAEEAPVAYKDVDEVVAVCEQAGLAHRVARLRPVGVVKG